MRQETDRPITITVSAGLPERLDAQGNPVIEALPLGKVPPVILNVGEAVIWLTPQQARGIADTLILASFNVEAQAQVNEFIAMLALSEGAPSAKQLTEAYAKYARYRAEASKEARGEAGDGKVF